jgi:hypothetical protein
VLNDWRLKSRETMPLHNPPLQIVDQMTEAFRSAEGFERSSFGASVGAPGDEKLIRSIHCYDSKCLTSVLVCGRPRSPWVRNVTSHLSQAGYQQKRKSQEVNEVWFERGLVDTRQRRAELSFLRELGEMGAPGRWPKRATIATRLAQRRRTPREWTSIIESTRTSGIAWDHCETSFARQTVLFRTESSPFILSVKTMAFGSLPSRTSIRMVVSIQGQLDLAEGMPSAIARRLRKDLRDAEYEKVEIHERGVKRALRGPVLGKKVMPTAEAAAHESARIFDLITDRMRRTT